MTNIWYFVSGGIIGGGDIAVQASTRSQSPTGSANHDSNGNGHGRNEVLSDGEKTRSSSELKDTGLVHEHLGTTSTNDTAGNPEDPLGFGRRRREDVTSAQLKKDHPQGNKRKLKKYYTRQNELIDQFLGAGDEERLAVAEEIKMGPKIRFAVNASFAVNACLFCIQLYAAISTGSLSLFATAADAFMDLVSSFVMFTTSRMAARPSVYKYPVVRDKSTNMFPSCKLTYLKKRVGQELKPWVSFYFAH